MKTKDRCLQFVENINETAEKMMVGSQFRNIPADQVDGGDERCHAARERRHECS